MRIVIVSDNALSAEAIRRGLRHAPNFQVIGYVDGARPCADAVAGAAPDLVVVDDRNGSRRVLDRVTEVRGTRPEAKVVLLTRSMDSDWLASAQTAGIHAAISRNVGATSLVTLIREIASGSVYHAFAPAPPAKSESREDNLTAREMQILRLVARGASNSAIATTLWVTEQTVKFHLSNVYRKLGVANRTEATHYAHLHDLLGPEVAPERAAVLTEAVAA